MYLIFFTNFLVMYFTVIMAQPCRGDNTDKIAHIEAHEKQIIQLTNKIIIFNEMYDDDKQPCLCTKLSYLCIIFKYTN